MNVTTSPDEILRTRRIVVCVGTGGVGKTTVAAALGLAAAQNGRRALVVTIDPARRLADALGVTHLGNDPQEISGASSPGSLHAVMLDAKSTFDGMVERLSGSPEARDRILENRFYQHISGALAGSSEYAAMQRVFELLQEENYDVILLDTPPAQHAFDFMDGPRRLLEFFESRIVRILLQPALRMSRLGLGVFGQGARRVLSQIENISGLSFLEDLSEFLRAFEEIGTGFRLRADELHRILTGPETAFVLVSAPHSDLSESGAALLDRLATEKAPLAGIVINRIRTWPGGGEVPEALLRPDEEVEGTDQLAEMLQPSSESPERRARAAVAAARDYALGVTLDRLQVSKLRTAAGNRRLFFRQVPQFDRDIHDLDALEWVVDALADPQQTTPGA